MPASSDHCGGDLNRAGVPAQRCTLHGAWCILCATCFPMRALRVACCIVNVRLPCFRSVTAVRPRRHGSPVRRCAALQRVVTDAERKLEQQTDERRERQVAMQLAACNIAAVPRIEATSTWHATQPECNTTSSWHRNATCSRATSAALPARAASNRGSLSVIRPVLQSAVLRCNGVRCVATECGALQHGAVCCNGVRCVATRSCLAAQERRAALMQRGTTVRHSIGRTGPQQRTKAVRSA